MSYNRFNSSNNAMLGIYNSALVRYRRKDNAGAADSIRNMAKNLIPKNSDGSNTINFYTLNPLSGTIEDAIAALKEGKTIRTLRILKHIQLEMHYGRYAL